MNIQKTPIVTYEFGILYIDGQPHEEGDTPLKKSTFNNLWNFILSKDDDIKETDKIMSVHTRRGHKYIKMGRYVGTIQTKDGQVIEILPKIYKNSGLQEQDKNICRNVFLNMLRHFSNSKALSFQNVSLSTKKNFPIFEVYISNYINDVEKLFLGGLKKNYAQVEENRNFLKGKLDISKQITKNLTNKAKFAVKYNKYIEDIPHNRIIVTTLRKLKNNSHNTINQARINTLLKLMIDIPSSSNIENDLMLASINNRLFTSYEILIKWSSQFLLNKGFTTFSGPYVNQSLLFKAEKLFEDFVAFLFKKYAPHYKVDIQNTKYYLVDRHNGKSMFKLRPDIVVEIDKNNPNYECVIIDTKWKSIDTTNKNYDLDMKDMYQMYVYGHKYMLGKSKDMGVEVLPKLVLLYPYSEHFNKELPLFIYDDIVGDNGLKLIVVPFNLTESTTYKAQVERIIQMTN